MSELKKGIRIAVLNKQRYQRHVMVALREEEDAVKETFNRPVLTFDESLQQVLEVRTLSFRKHVFQIQCENMRREKI